MPRRAASSRALQYRYMDAVFGVFGTTGLGWVLLVSYVAIVWFPVAILVALAQLTVAFAGRVRGSQRPGTASVSREEISEPGLALPVPMVIHWLITLTPVLLFVALRSVAWRAQVLIGHWPQVMADDPKWIGESDMPYQRLYDLTHLAFGLAGWSPMVWIAFFVTLYGSYTRTQRKAIVWTYTAAWMLALLGDGNGIAWYMD